MTAKMLKWVAAGVVAVATIPAVGFARTHHPVQAALPSLMATATDAVVTNVAEVTSAKPVALKATSRQKLHAAKHSKLRSSKTAHRSLSSTKHRSHSLSHKHRKHSNLHSARKHVA